MSGEILAAGFAFRFDGFYLDRRNLRRRQESGDDEPVMLGSRALDVLTALVERRGELVTKQALMDTVWPGLTVEDSNLAVQISSLRRVLDEGRTGSSSIQTVIGRGYRFLPAVTVEAPPPPRSIPVPADDIAAPTRPARRDELPVAEMPADHGRRGRRLTPRLLTLVLLTLVLLTLAGVLILLSGALLTWGAQDGRLMWGAVDGRRATAVPPLSLVILPFQNLSGDANDDYLVDGVTDDLTTGLSHIPEAFVIARSSARTYKGKAVDVRQIGHELGVRYVVDGSARRSGTILRVNVELTSTETGAQLWSDRFDESIADLSAGQDAILARMRGTLGVSLIEVEVARQRRAPPTIPDAFDLILRARALRNQPYDRQRFAQALSFYEQALQLDPNSVLALTGATAMLLDAANYPDTPFTFERRRQVAELVARAQKIAPASEEVLGAYASLLATQTDCSRSMPAARLMIETYPNPTFGYGLLSECLIVTGHSQEVIPLMEKAFRLNPRDAFLARQLNLLGSAYLWVNDNDMAIEWLGRALQQNPASKDRFPGGTKRKLASAYARTGKNADARRMLAEADKDWPFDTVRGHFPDDINPIFAAQVRQYQEGLRAAGERDHAEEDADYGVTVDAVLHPNPNGYTPLTTPGAETIRTADLPRFIVERNPVIIDPLTYFWGKSIPGAVGLKDAGIGGTLSDEAQNRLGRKMASLTTGNLNRPLVAVGWNSERLDGRNLALRLVALGYTQVYWYRGGREAWEASGQPEAELVPQDW
jgi:adenylate cyclase